MGQQTIPPLNLPGLTMNHVAIAVHDLEEARTRLSALGMSFLPTFKLEIPTVYRGVETVAVISGAFAPGNPIPVELVQPTGGESTIASFLRDHGEGVQHFGYLADDLKAVIVQVGAAGVEVDWLIEDEHGPAIAFLSGDAMFGVSAEVVRRDPQVSLQQWLKP